MLKLFKLFLLILVVVLNVSVVHSFVAVDPSKALSMDMIGRDGPRKRTTVSSSSASAPAPVVSSASGEGTAKTIVIGDDGEKLPTSFDDVVDKQGMLKQLFPQKAASRGQETQIKALNLDMISKTTVRARVPVGYMIRVVVPEAEHEEWRIDSKGEILENVDSQKYEQYRLLDFKAVKPGSEVMYLDSVDTSFDPARPLESRIIRLSVTP